MTIYSREAKIAVDDVSGKRTLLYTSDTGRQEAAEFEDQNLVLDNEGQGHAFDIEHGTANLQFLRHVALPIPLFPLPQVLPGDVQELLTTCLSAIRSLADDEQWRALGVRLNDLLDQARAHRVPVPAHDCE